MHAILQCINLTKGRSEKIPLVDFLKTLSQSKKLVSDSPKKGDILVCCYENTIDENTIDVALMYKNTHEDAYRYCCFLYYGKFIYSALNKNASFINLSSILRNLVI